MALDDLSVNQLGEQVKSVHGEEVYQAAFKRAVGIASKKAARLESAERQPLSPDHPDGPPSSKVLVADALAVALRTEFIRLLRPQ